MDSMWQGLSVMGIWGLAVYLLLRHLTKGLDIKDAPPVKKQAPRRKDVMS